MTQTQRAAYDIKMQRAFERGQYDSYHGRPMTKDKTMGTAELRRYIDGYHCMMDRKRI